MLGTDDVADAVITTTRYPSNVHHCRPDTMFACRDGACISASLVCNGEANCVDRSDEGPGCQLLTPQTGTVIIIITGNYYYGRFTTKCKSDSVIALKWQISL